MEAGKQYEKVPLFFAHPFISEKISAYLIEDTFLTHDYEAPDRRTPTEFCLP